MCSIEEFADARAPVNRIVRFSCVDGPGNRTAVFTQGCCYHCVYCHNPETINACTGCGKCVEHCPTGALRMENGKISYAREKCALCDQCLRSCENSASPRVELKTAEEVMREIEKNMPFIRGVTVSGGECTLHRDFLVALAALAHRRGLDFLLDCNGSNDFERDARLTAAIDGAMLDVKAWDRAEHLRLTGRENDPVKKNLRFLAENGKLEEVRTVVVPGWMNAEETLRETCAVLKRFAPDTRYKIIKYRPMGVRSPYRETLRSPEDAELKRLEDIAHALGILNTVIL